MRVCVRIGVGGILLLALLFLSLVACANIEAKPADTGTTERAGEYEVSMDMEPNPPRTGQPAELTFTVLKGGEPVEASETTPRLILDMPKMPMGLPEVPLEAVGPGQWRAKNVQFPMAGGWAATLALPSSGEEEKVTFEFDVAP